MTLAMRIYLGMGSMVALIVILGGFAAFQTSRLADTFIDYRTTARDSLLAGDFLEDMFEARLASAKYRLTKDQAFVEEVSGNIAEVVDLKKALTEIISHYEGLGPVAGIPDLLAEYERLMGEAYELQQQRDTLVQTSADTGVKARRQLSEVMETALRDDDAVAAAAAGEAGINLMLARYYLEKYLVDNRPEDAARSNQEIENARVGLTELMTELQNPRRRELTEETMRDLDVFDATSEAVADVIAQRNTRYDRMDEIGPEALALVESTVDAVVAQQNSLGPAGVAMADRSILIVSLLVAAATVIGAGLAFFTGRAIASRLAQVTADMNQLATGDLDIEIERTEARHEIGQMTNAMVVFLENARKARDLDLEVKEKERLARERDEDERARQAQLEQEKRDRDEREREAERARLETAQEFQKQMERVLGKAASGDFSERLPADIEDDGLVQLAQIVNRLLEQTEDSIDDLVRSIGELSNGNLGVRIEGERSGVFLRMKNDFNSALSALSNTMSDIMESGKTVSATSHHLETSANDMSKRAEDAAAAIEETSAAVEEIASSISQVVENARSADAATQKVRKGADVSRDVSDQTEASIGTIAEASGQINSVVKVIEDIAFQINLLALNAGVEAARAGEAGRGFSVVASEVRALAQRSQEAVQEISTVIDQNAQSVKTGVEHVTQSRKALEAIIADVETASTQISEIAMAVEQQSSGIQEVNLAIGSIDRTAQNNAATLEEMTAASVSTSKEAQNLAKALSQFHGLPEVGAQKPMARDAGIEPPRQRQASQSAGGAQPEAVSGWEEF
ncbi:methyl-accepting chemotaxis protein [Roseobacter sp. S98]|uniref:methyl-accepting chemotaxis protein n=1 Tax=Roseobacter algicola (ex Choi et al. 2025) (nom. illeg.) TaxID=3092138 RepID=UPI003F518F51